MSTRLLIVEDHAMVREGLKYILQQAPDMQVVAEAASVAEALAALEQPGIDVVLLDIGLGKESGFELLSALKQRAAAPKVLVVSSYAESDHAMQALADGAAGFVSKGSTPTVLLNAIRQAVGGQRYISAELNAQMASNLRKGTAAADTLSQRELQILRGLATGSTQTAIAAELGISVKTVNTYRTRLLTKTATTSTAELIRYAIRRGLVSA